MKSSEDEEEDSSASVNGVSLFTLVSLFALQLIQGN